MDDKKKTSAEPEDHLSAGLQLLVPVCQTVQGRAGVACLVQPVVSPSTGDPLKMQEINRENTDETKYLLSRPPLPVTTIIHPKSITENHKPCLNPALKESY